MQEHEWRTEAAPSAAQVDIYVRPGQYSAFPHLIRLKGDELLMAFREAPQEEGIHHTHQRSIITLIRSRDAGASWDVEQASQLGAGGGQEFALISLEGGRVAGALAWHDVVPVSEAARTGIPHLDAGEYPYRSGGTMWLWSDTFGYTWPPHQVCLLSAGTMPCGTVYRMRDGALLCPVYGLHAGGMSSLLHQSRDDGRSWSAPVVMAQGSCAAGDYCEPCVVETSPGMLLALHRVEGAVPGSGYFHVNRSTDGGASWSVPVGTGIYSGACPRLLPLSDGRLLLTFGRRVPPFGIRAMLSEDGGASWGETAWEIRPAGNWNQGYTSSVELGQGRLLTVTYADDACGTTGIVGTFWTLPW